MRTQSWNNEKGRSQRRQLSSENRRGLMSRREVGFLQKGRFNQVRTRSSRSTDGGAPWFSTFGGLAVLIKTKKGMCSRVQTFLFLATLLEKNAEGCNAHKEGYTRVFNTELLVRAKRWEMI